MPADDSFQRMAVRKVSLMYVRDVFPLFGLLAGAFWAPRTIGLLVSFSYGCWYACRVHKGCHLRTGRPDPEYSKNDPFIRLMREYFPLTLHRTKEVQDDLLSASGTGQAIFAVFPHGVNADFRVLMDGLLYSSFPKVYEKAPARTLSASILFKIPFVREVCIKTGCVDASRRTAEHVLKKGHSVLVCPGGEDEQLETMHGRERVFLKQRVGFLRLAIIHGVPVVPVYVFGSSDLYYTSRILYGLRRWLVRNLRICIPVYCGRLGFYTYPTPMGFPLSVSQDIVFGTPLRFKQSATPSSEEIMNAHEAFIAALAKLFDNEKERFGYADRKLEIL